MKKKSCLLGCLEGNKNKCHSKLDLESHRFLKRQQCEILNQVQDDVFFYDNGFTLLELLVVFLIIGILAAVALPQYQKAVWKSRYIQAKTLATSVAQAEEVYYMANGTYTRNYDELDVDIPPTTENIVCYSEGCYARYAWGRCGLGENSMGCVVYKNGSEYLAYTVGFIHSTTDHKETAHCLAWGSTGKPTSSDINYQICKAETKDPYPTSWSENAYGWEYQ